MVIITSVRLKGGTVYGIAGPRALHGSAQDVSGSLSPAREGRGPLTLSNALEFISLQGSIVDSSPEAWLPMVTASVMGPGHQLSPERGDRVGGLALPACRPCLLHSAHPGSCP